MSGITNEQTPKEQQDINVRKQVECIIFRQNDHGREYLLLKRIPERGGFWQPVTGGVEKEDDSVLDACLRELSEETGISSKDIIKTIENIYQFRFSDNGNDFFERVWAFQVRDDTIVDIYNNIYPEHSQFQWVSFDKALELLRWSGNKNAFIKLEKLFDREKNPR